MVTKTRDRKRQQSPQEQIEKLPPLRVTPDYRLTLIYISVVLTAIFVLLIVNGARH